jgi:diaminohydroxyphosphoribosylaminopyrimidine deaminase/5-amino-6-(5-phosphoribosylamino)uracil reductase
MLRAVAEARRSLPSPNPRVGAVVVAADGSLASVARHGAAGQAHAEQLALEAAGAKAAGGTLYVTLEPCNHTGRTPPCVDAVLQAGIKRVVVGALDPNPHVTGGGVDRLRLHGLEVVVGVAARECDDLIAPWKVYITSARPHVRLKLALSLDGRIAARTGESKWVTGPEARAKVQELRADVDAVAVGIGTAIADDPRLTVREPLLSRVRRSPTRVIFDTNLRLPITHRVVVSARETPTWIICGASADTKLEAALVGAGCRVLRAANSAEGRVSVEDALRVLADQGIVSLLVEGGAELAGSFLVAGLADELHAFLAPILLGPRGRPAAVDWAGPDSPASAPRIFHPRWEVCGRDAYVHGRLLDAQGDETEPTSRA